MGRTRLRRAPIVIAAGLALTACSSPSVVQAGDQAATSSTPTTSTTAPTTTTTAPQYVRSWTLTSTDANGDSQSAVLSVGSAEHYSSTDQDGDFTIGTTCSLDSQTDAVVPAQLVITNTTKGFNFQVSVSMAGLQTQWEVDYSSGPQCVGGSQGSGAPSLNVQSTDALKPGASTTLDLFFIYPNYYTPNQPTGNPGLLDAAIDFTGLSASQSGGHDVSLSGPGASQSFIGAWTFAVSGNTPTF